MKLNIYDEQALDLLHFIFERELAPPFRKGKKDNTDRYLYYNRDDEYIGWLDSIKYFGVRGSFLLNIKDKVCQVFEFPYDTSEWWDEIAPHLESWLENQINVKLNTICQWS